MGSMHHDILTEDEVRAQAPVLPAMIQMAEEVEIWIKSDDGTRNPVRGFVVGIKFDTKAFTTYDVALRIQGSEFFVVLRNYIGQITTIDGNTIDLSGLTGTEDEIDEAIEVMSETDLPRVRPSLSIVK